MVRTPASNDRSGSSGFVSRVRDLAEKPVPPWSLPGTLLIAAAVFAGVSWLPSLDEPQTPALEALRRSGALPAAEDILELRTAKLAVRSSGFQIGRNIFAQGRAAEPQLSEREARADDRKPKEDEKRRRTAARKPALDVALLGVFGPPRLRIAVLEHRDAEHPGSGISNVVERDLVPGGYRVQKIDLNSVLFSREGAPGAAPVLLELGGRRGAR